jgi:hypothetical protein
MLRNAGLDEFFYMQEAQKRMNAGLDEFPHM